MIGDGEIISDKTQSQELKTPSTIGFLLYVLAANDLGNQVIFGTQLERAPIEVVL
jgi:hypothetical protein